ncbi:MAG: anaerobic ribonucleoside-triphosphate reductase activating protein [Euryarchaeota archaeon]|nr:anaerobic ribonucleoside-triphosphate reductase activating protein [Euryarchaeota archaeon]
MLARIVGFAKTSLLDWDGMVATTVYLQGCNLRCPFCHNPDLISISAEVEEAPWEVLKEYLEDNTDFLDGVVVTGGEATQSENLPELIRKIRDLGLKVKLDTNGTNPDMLQDLLQAGLLDCVAMDLKGPLDHQYSQVCGTDVDIEAIKRSIGIIMISGIDYEFRTTVVPHYLSPGDIERMASFIGGAKKYALQQFRNDKTLDKRLSKVEPYSEAQMLGMAETARKYVRKVIVRGI